MIDSFKGKYRFLSNFFPAIINWEGINYPTVEHAYQAAKTHDPNIRKYISSALTAQEAKHIGKNVLLRGDWEEKKLEIMDQLIRLKFSNREVMNLLKLTENEELIEGNWWGDTYWGVCNGVGENHLGKILMKIRGEQNDVHY